MANVIPFPSAKGECTPAELFLRVGEASYSKVASLYAEGRLPIARAIIDASKLRHQLSFVKTLRDDGVELILDTKAAELGALSKYQGWDSGTPWADGTLHLPGEFDDQRCRKLVEAIAQEAVEKGFDRVLAPTHFLKGGVLDPWFSVDIRLCGLLRESLDRLGGTHISIDYPVIIEQLKLRDEAVRGALISQLASLPFENLVIRASHFGADAKATGIREFINVLDRLHNFGRPIVVDHVGGIVGRALLAFGVASGIAHGIDEHMRFDGTPWGRAPKKRDEDEGRGGSAKRISIPLLDKHLTVPELQALAKAKGGRGLLVCGDPNCCRGLTDMVNNSKRHSIHQETLALNSLNRVPDLMRAQHFLDKDLAEVDRFARQVKELKPVVSELRPRKGQTPEQAAASFTKRIADHAFQKEKMRVSLENLHSVRGLGVSRVPAAHLATRIKENRKNSQFMTAAVARYIDDLQDQGGLKGTDIANFTDVSSATVHRWKVGSHSPHPKAQLILAALHYIVSRLDAYYNPQEVRLWLYAPHPQLEGRRAIDSIVEGNAEEVIAIIDRLDAEVYL